MSLPLSSSSTTMMKSTNTTTTSSSSSSSSSSYNLLPSKRGKFLFFIILLTLINILLMSPSLSSSSSYFRNTSSCGDNDNKKKLKNDIIYYPLSSGGKKEETTNNSSSRIISSTSTDNETTKIISQEEEEENDDYEEEDYTLVVVRCHGSLDWLIEVPSDWRVIVYEKCGEQQQPKTIQTTKNNTNSKLLNQVETVTTASNVGAEECNGYFDYLYDYYYNLTDVTIFFHDDGLIPYTKPGRLDAIKRGIEQYHTPFHNFSQVVNATKTYLNSNQTFLHFGTRTLYDNFGNDRYHGLSQKFLWPFLRTNDNPKPPTRIVFKPSGHIAVRKEAILRHKRTNYLSLLQQSRYIRDATSQHDASRQICCAMERMWHILFGQSPILPKSAMVYDLLKEKYGELYTL